MGMAGRVQCRTNRSNLAIHHSAWRGEVSACFGLSNSSLPVDLEGRVVVDIATCVEHAAVAVRRVFINAEVGHQHHVVAHVAAQVAQGHLHDAVRIKCTASNIVFRRRNAEQDYAFDPDTAQLRYFFSQRLDRVLEDSRQRTNWLRLRDSFSNEQRRDQIIDAKSRLGNEAAHRWGSAKATRTLRRGGKAHPAIVGLVSRCRRALREPRL